MNRRAFMSTLAAPAILAQTGRKYRTALIGSGWWGMNILGCAMESGECTVVAMCDVDENQLNPAVEKVVQLSGDQPKKYKDYRELLAQEKPDIAIVATPDHWHPLAAIAAVNAGAHVYVEKPISHTILEGRAMVKAARAANRVVQVGLHRRVSPHNVAGREFLRSGKAGKIGMVRAFVHYPGGPGKPTPDSAPPKGLDWDFWCGPAPLRPYNKAIHPKGFRQFLDFGNGTEGTFHMGWLDGWTFYPTGKGKEVIHQEPQLNKPDDQNIKQLWADFLDAIKTGRRPVSDIELGHRSTNLSLLAMLSLKLGRSLAWDGEKGVVIGDPEANRLLRRPYRGPWRYPEA